MKLRQEQLINTPPLSIHNQNNDAVQIYFNEIGITDLLTAEQEFQLSVLNKAIYFLEQAESALHSTDEEVLPKMLYTILCDKAIESWQQTTAGLAQYEPKTPLPDLSALIKEAQRLGTNWKTAPPSALRVYFKLHKWEEDKAWNQIIESTYQVFLFFLLLPEGMLDQLLQFFYLHGNHFPSVQELKAMIPCTFDLVTQIKKIQIQSNVASQMLIRSNLRLVANIARNFAGYEAPFLDLVQEGNLGLMDAVARFAPQRGFRLSTYATWWIKRSILQYLSKQSRLIRLPTHVLEAITKMNKNRLDFFNRTGREPSFEELALLSDFLTEKEKKKITQLRKDDLPLSLPLKQKLTTAIVKIQELIVFAEKPISLESPIQDQENELYLGDLIEYEDSDDPMKTVTIAWAKEQILRSLDLLTERERQILEFHFGLNDENPMTREEISRKFGLTYERIRQIESSALRKLRHPALSRILREYY